MQYSAGKTDVFGWVLLLRHSGEKKKPEQQNVLRLFGDS
jgi:hypothetical protein